MVEIGDLVGKLAVGVVWWVIGIVVGIIVIVALGFIGWWYFRRKKWNLKVGVKLPRADGTAIISEIAKGHFDAEAGIVDIKRKKMKAHGMKPFDVRKYLQGIDYLEVLQVGVKEYIPILPKSYTVLQNQSDPNDKIAILDIEADTGGRKTWSQYFERVAKARFTLMGFLDKHWRAIELGLIIFLLFLGFAVMWIRLPSICG